MAVVRELVEIIESAAQVEQAALLGAELGVVRQVPANTYVTELDVAGYTNGMVVGPTPPSSADQLWADTTVEGSDLTVLTQPVPYFDVRDFGAVGDGTTDDTAAVQAAFDALHAAGGGVLLFPGGHEFLISATITWEISGPQIVVSAYSSEVTWDGANNDTMFEFFRPSGGDQSGVRFLGGSYKAAGSTGVTGIHIRDRGTLFRDVNFNDFVGGKCIHLENWFAWCERTRIHSCTFQTMRHALYFTSGTESAGTGGTDSFARTVMTDCMFSFGEAGYGLIRTSGNVYHSRFSGLYGNLTGGEHIFACDASTSFNGTLIENLGFEGASASTYVLYSSTGATSDAPLIRHFKQIGTNMEVANLSAGVDNMKHAVIGSHFYNDVDNAGGEPTGTEWAIHIGAQKEIVSARPTGGTRICMIATDASDRLILGSGTASRAPSEVRVATAVPFRGPSTWGFNVTPTVTQTGWTTFTNLTTDKTCDADTVTVAELADIVGTLIVELKAKGLLA